MFILLGCFMNSTRRSQAFFSSKEKIDFKLNKLIVEKLNQGI
jgi:hypothetical protein